MGNNDRGPQAFAGEIVDSIRCVMIPVFVLPDRRTQVNL